MMREEIQTVNKVQILSYDDRWEAAKGSRLNAQRNRQDANPSPLVTN